MDALQVANQQQAKLLAVAQELGHEIRVLTNSAISPTSNEPSACSDEESDDFYDLTPEDYYRIKSDRVGELSQILKGPRLQELQAAAHEAACRARIPKAVIRVLFPDNYILEAKFQSSDKVQSLMDLLMKVVARPDLPFFLYTTPPKELIRDISKDFYSAGFAPGANIYFSYDLPKASDVNNTYNMGPYLRDDIVSLNGLDFACQRVDPGFYGEETSALESHAAIPLPRPIPKKPRWFKH